MSTRPNPAERLLALLAGETETLPAEQVRGDLAALGIDPARSINLAKRLASSPPSPGAALLGALGAADEAEREIARIESADIEDVRRQIPEGAAAAIAAEARRKAGADSNVVGIQPRRRSRVLLWGGPLTGIAASILLVVAGLSYMNRDLVNSFNGGTDELVAAKAPAPEKKSPAPGEPAEESEITMLEDSKGYRADEARKQEKETFGLFSGKPESDLPAQAPAEQPAPVGNLAESVARSFESADEAVSARARESAKTRGGEAAGAPVSVPEPEASVADSGMAGGAVDSDSFDDRRLAKQIAPGLAAMLIVEESLAPATLRSQTLPTGGLAGRLEEARRLAGDRPVIALMSIESAAGRRDFAQVPLMPRMTQQMAPPPPLAGLLGDEVRQYDFIELPR